MGQSVYINFDTENLRSARCRGIDDLRNQKFTQFVVGDSIELDLYLTGTGGALNIQDYSEIRLGMGNLDARPESGSYQVGGSQTLAYNHSASDLQTAVASIASSNVTTELTGFVFKVQFDAVGAQDIPSIDNTLLQPRSTVSVTKLVTGDSTTKEVWLWRIFRDPLAFTNTFTNIATNGVRGTLSLATAGLYELIAQSGAVKTFFEVELTSSDGNVRTVLQAQVDLNAEVIGHNFSGSIPFSPTIPAAASTFLSSFPNPEIVGDLDIQGGLQVFGDVTFEESVGFEKGAEFKEEVTIADVLTISAQLTPDEDAKLELIDKSTGSTQRGGLYKKNGKLYVGTFTDYTKNIEFTAEGSGQILDFPADSGIRFHGGNLLEKYAEGTFSPKLESGDGTIVQSVYQVRQANYVRIGDLIQVNIRIEINNFDTAWKTSTKDWRITDLPYSAIGNHNIEIRPIRGWMDLGDANITGALQSGNDYLWVEKFANNGTTAGAGNNTSRINANSFATHPFNFTTGSFEFIITGAYKTNDA